MCNRNDSALHPDCKQGMADLGYTGHQTGWPDNQPWAFMRFASTKDSAIEPAVMRTLRFREDAEGKPVVQDSFSCGDISKALLDPLAETQPTAVRRRAGMDQPRVAALIALVAALTWVPPTHAQAPEYQVPHGADKFGRIVYPAAASWMPRRVALNSCLLYTSPSPRD